MAYFKNKKIYLLIGLMIFITIVVLTVDIAFAADVGNTFSTNSSSRSSSSSSSYSGGGGSSFFLMYLLFSLPFPLNLIVWGVIIFGGVYGTKKHNSNRNVNVNPTVNIDNSFSESNVVSTIKRNDELFSANEFKAFTKDIYIKLQEAWEAKQWEGIRPFESEELFRLHSKQLDEYIENQTTPHLDKQEILSVAIADFEIDGKYEYITVKLCASLLAFLTDKNGNVINGSPKNRVYREYKLVFKRVHGVKTNSDKKTATTNCPNCGAPNKITSSGVCEFCNSLITTGDYGWVLNEYGQWR